MRPFAATSIPLQDPNVIEDRLLALGRALRISLTSALGEIGDGEQTARLSQDILDAGPIIAGSHYNEEKFGGRKAPEFQIADWNVVTITSSSA
ncbi:hypothetical protein ACC732_08585 [Rhizobium ruizarguesonis]